MTQQVTSSSTQKPGTRQRIGGIAHGFMRSLGPGKPAIAAHDLDTTMDQVAFDAADCRNCGASHTQLYCGSCGQKSAKRFCLGDIWGEIWQRGRLFELSLLQSGLRLLHSPGLVARDYVLGARKRHVHPVKLLLIAVTVLVLLLARTGYLTAGQTLLTEQMQLVVAWARWSFTLGLAALVLATSAVMHGRLGYNLVEQLVFAAYVQFVVITLNVLNLLPLLVMDAARWAAPWRQAAGWYMTPLELAVVAIACKQFFRLQWRSDGLRIVALLLVFHLCKKALVFGYAHLIQQVVLHQAV